MCVDYRALNLNIHKNAFPLTRVNDFFDALGGAKIFFP